MSKARLIITAVITEGRSQHEVARAYGINQSWVSRLGARYRAEGEAAFQPRSRRPKTSPTAIPPATVTLITELRDKLTTAGLDGGPDTIAWHLAHHNSSPLRRPGLDVDRQRDGLHHPLCRRPRRPQRPGGRAAPPQRRAENSRPNKPTTCGKVERFQQTLKQWLRAQPHQPTNLVELQQLLDQFVAVDNHQRPHRSLPGRATPAVAYQARPKATPTTGRNHDTHDRVRRDRIDTDGKVTLRVNGRLHHIGIGRTHARTPVLLLVQDLHVRVVNATTGELLRELIIDPTRDYQPIHPQQAETTSPRTHIEGSG